MTRMQQRATSSALGRVIRRGKWVIGACWLTSSVSASAQTWAGNRLRPSLNEIAVIDRTGETNWLWGQEDVAGDGAGQFTAAEQAIDARSVYLRVEGSRLWWRTYVSATVAPESNFDAYLFVDADSNDNTGLSAAATEVDPAFSADPSIGGYEFVIAVRGDGTQPVLWEQNAQGTAFVAAATPAAQLDAEAGLTVDPLRVGALEHGYAQASIVANLVAVTAQCQARFYVRTTNQTQALGLGDLDVGEAVRCTPADTNQNQVPDVIEPTAQCATNAECPNGGICWNGSCWLAPVCLDDPDCAANYTCENGSCVAVTGTTCGDDSDCLTGVCTAGQCVLCTSDASCGAGQVCAPDGRCINENVAGPSAGGTGNTGSNTAGTSGVYLLEGERLQGGPCACRYVSDAKRTRSLGWLAVAAGLGIWRSRRPSRRGLSR